MSITTIDDDHDDYARKFHLLAMQAALVERAERPSTKHAGVTRTHLRFTAFGTRFGINVPTARPNGSGAIRWREDRFAEALGRVSSTP